MQKIRRLFLTCCGFFLFLALIFSTSLRAGLDKNKCRELLRPYTVVVAPVYFSEQEHQNVKKINKSKKKKKEYEHLFGGEVVIIDETKSVPSKPEVVSGLVLHMGDAQKLSRYVKGRSNPLVGDDNLDKKIGWNKWHEYKIIYAIDETAIPEAVNAKDILQQNPAVFKELTNNLKQSVFYFLQHKKSKSAAKELVKNVKLLIKRFFYEVELIYSEGAFVKYVAEAGTADDDEIITTFKSKPKLLAKKFIRDLRLFKKSSFLSEASVFDVLLQADLTSSTKLISSLLSDPRKIMAQKRISIAKTRDEFSKEIRVDFAAGAVRNATFRWSAEYDPELMQRATEFVEDFLEKAPPKFKKMSGGADVVVRDDGSLVFIELNPGAESGFIDPRDDMINGNKFISAMVGRPTRLLQELNKAFSSGIAAQARVLAQSSLDDDLPDDDDSDITYNFSVRDMSFTEAFKFFRDAYLDEWRKNPSLPASKQVIKNLNLLLASQGQRIRHDETRDEIMDIIMLAKFYMKNNTR